MRIVVSALVGIIGLAMVALTAQAFSAGSIRPDAAANPYVVEAAQGCGPGFHWVGKHRNRYGAWVPGHCARN